MTQINRMVMKGFKSFGDRTELVFGPKFNCILGPNGSGKSNVMDALCFVLGKGSAKGLRAEKSANLIYNGGKTKEPAKQGEVSIYFSNERREFPIDTAEVKITRIIKEDGQSVYKINDKRRTRQEVLELLAMANIDPDGYNIILQGDITRLVEMSSIERRQIVEEIAGISVYEEKKQRALNELEKVEQRINEAEIILTERQSYLKELKKDRDQAIKYKELNDNLKRVKATLLSIQIKGKEGQLAGLAKQKDSQEKNISEMQKQIEEHKKKISELKDEIKRINEEIEEKGEKEQIRLLKEIEGIKVEIGTLKNKIEFDQNEIKRVNARKEQLEQNLAELKKKIKDLTEEKANLEKEKKSVSEEITLFSTKIKSFREAHHLDDSEGLELDIDRLDKTAEEREKAIALLREEQQRLLRDKDRLEFQISGIDDKIAKVLQIEKEHKGEIEKLKQKRQEFKKITLELNQLLNEDSSLSAQLHQARQKILSAEETISKLRAQSASIRGQVQDSIAVKTILESKNKFGKVYGTVSELGHVSSKYSLALEVAAGPRIKSIVVDTDKTAAECIKYLKKNRLGTATFLPLNKIKSQDPKIADLKQILKEKGVHGLAIDLITFDPEFENAFGYVFGNTIVVEDIDTARSIGIGRIRMVTLDGDLVEISGAMHGGFKQKQRGIGFQEKELGNEIKESEKKLADSQKLVSVLEKRKRENEEKITRLRELKAGLEGEIIVAEKSLHLESEDLEATKSEKSRLQGELKLVEKSLDEIISKISTGNKELAELKMKKQVLREKISQMRNPAILAELNTFEEKQRELREQLIKIEGNIRNIVTQIDNILKPEHDNIMKIIAQHNKEESLFKTEIKEINEKIKQKESALKDSEKQQKQFYSKYKELYIKKDKSNSELQKRENSLINFEESIRRAEQRINTISLDIATARAELGALQEEFTKYKEIELLKEKSEEVLRKDLWQYEKLIEQAGNVNLRALEVYDAIEKEYNELIEKKNKLSAEKEEVLGMMKEIEAKKKELFIKTFAIIDKNFQAMFVNVAPKGEAFLELENPNEPFAGGMFIKVRITGKKFLDIRGLSGGEKTLTALAFLFAIQEYEPASFYVLDEVDAALDKRNSEKLANFIRQYSEKAQYILISHNDGIIASADTLYGVSMNEHGVSKVVSLKL
ncbi:MAG: chromosome segregation protein SMC [Candidatus Woesearchaeota archaeon]